MNLDIFSKHAVPFQMWEALLVLAFAWLLLRALRKFEVFCEQKGLVRASSFAFFDQRLAPIGFFFMTALTLLQIAGIPLSALLTVSGVGGVLLGFAAKDGLANLFTGVTLHLDQTFKEGDWIRSPDRSIEGTVENVGWRSTKIRTLDRRLLLVPNALFSSMIIENVSRMSHRRIKTFLNVRYEDHLLVPSWLSAVREVMERHPAVDVTESNECCVHGTSELGVQILLLVYLAPLATHEFYRAQEELFNSVLTLAMEHGVRMVTVPPSPTYSEEKTNDR